MPPSIELAVQSLKLATAYPFGISRGTSTEKHNLLVRLRYGEHEGLGEAAPSTFYGENADSCRESLERWHQAGLPGDNPFAIVEIMKRIDQIDSGSYAARAALETALWDLCGKIAGQPVHRLLGLGTGKPLPHTCFTIGIDDLATIEKKTQEAVAAGHQALKIKQGTTYDRQIIECVRKAAPKIALQVDANGAWSVEQAIEMSADLFEAGVELMEQPLPHTATPEEFACLRSKSALPVYADESVKRAADVPQFKDCIDGVVVKLAKTGGLAEAISLIATARACGMKVMFGCMIESSLGITAAAQLASLCDYLDLDGALLLASDPFVGLTIEQGHLNLPRTPGLGVRKRT